MKRNKKRSPSIAATSITEAALKDIQIVLLQREVLATQVRNALAQAEQAVGVAFIAAGLDPAKNYKLDRDTLTATEVVK